MEKSVAVNTKGVHVLDARACVPEERVVLLLGHGQITVPGSGEKWEERRVRVRVRVSVRVRVRVRVRVGVRVRF